MDTDANIYNCKERISAGLHHHSWNYTVKSPEEREKYYIRVSVAVSNTSNVCFHQRNLLWLNWISGIVEWVTHYISEGVVQLSEHLRKERKAQLIITTHVIDTSRLFCCCCCEMYTFHLCNSHFWFRCLAEMCWKNRQQSQTSL